MLASTTRLLLGQRLIKRLCPGCRRPHRKSEAYAEQFRHILGSISSADGPARPQFHEAGGGCPQCNRSGYSGRVGIFEVREIRGEVADLLVRDRARFDPRSAELVFSGACACGDARARNLREDGMLKAALGLTTPEEVFGATMQENADA